MRKRIAIFILFLLVIFGVYLNRAYAHIYQTIDGPHLISPDTIRFYTLGEGGGESFRYVAMGDSLTAGVGVSDYHDAYPYLLATFLSKEKGQVMLEDVGVAGYRVSDVLTRALPHVIAEKPSVVTLLVGTNDIHGHVSLQEFKKTYESIVRQLSEMKETKVYLVTIPHLGSPTLLFPPYDWYFDWQTRRYNRVVEDVARAYHVNLIDLYADTREIAHVDGSYYSSDFFHPSAVGYRLWAEIFYAHLHR